MRGDLVYCVYGVHEKRSADTHFGTYRTVLEAESAIACIRERNGSEWQQRYHDRGFEIRSVAVDIDFELPALPKPRDRYFVRGTPKANSPGTWPSTIVEVLRRTQGAPEPVCEYERNYSLLQTFEPFRKGNRDFALISRDYTTTAVLDLASGLVIAEELEITPGGGFCPAGFYVPDWWDIHDGSIIPGSPHWSADREWPLEPFGFVWGCHWGDDSSWKVQFLDLSGIEAGLIARDERFGYVELARATWSNPCINPPSDVLDRPSSPPPFIAIHSSPGKALVTFAVAMAFDLETGVCPEWQRIDGPE